MGTAGSRPRVAVSHVQAFSFGHTRPGLVLGFGAIAEERVPAGLRALRAAIDADPCRHAPAV